MLARKRIFLMALLCLNITIVNSQSSFGSVNDKYLIKTGQKEFIPEENVNEFNQIKKELKNNEHEGWYYAIVQFQENPLQIQISQMSGKINPLISIGKTSYICGLSTNMTKKQLKKYSVRAIVVLSSELKIDAELTENQEETTKVDIYVSNELEKKFVKSNIEEAGGELKMKMDSENSTIYTFKISSAEIKTIANFPWLLKITPSQY